MASLKGKERAKASIKKRLKSKNSFFLKKKLVTPEDFPNHSLCGNPITGNGMIDTNAYFRGKVYDRFIDEISGETLYTEEGNHEFILDIAVALETANITELTYAAFGITQEEINDLTKVFRYAADNDLTYVGWW